MISKDGIDEINNTDLLMRWCNQCFNYGKCVNPNMYDCLKGQYSAKVDEVWKREGCK